MVKYLRGPCTNCRTLITGAEGSDITCPNCKGITRVPLTTPAPELEPIPEITLEPAPEETPPVEEPQEWPVAETNEPPAETFEAPPEAEFISEPTPAPVPPLEAPNKPSIGRAVIGGILGALVGAIAWGLIAKLVDTTALGAVAVAIGALCGALILAFTLKTQSLGYKVVAVLATLAGIFGGKYLVYYVDHKSYPGTFMERVGRAFDPAVIGDFFGEVGAVFDPLDALWIFLALAVAWIIPRPYLLGLKMRAKTSSANA